MVRISRHKTATQGPSLVFLSDTEEKALAAYLKYYRPLAVGCCDPECIVFPNRPSDSQEACCTKMSFSSLSRAISKTARKCKVSHQVTSRILRRSQITALWKKKKKRRSCLALQGSRAMLPLTCDRKEIL